MWYDLAPADYAYQLRFNADRSIANAAKRRSENRSWSETDARDFERQARRLRAMAILCERSDAARAGNVDFLRLDRPEISREDEDAAIAIAESL